MGLVGGHAWYEAGMDLFQVHAAINDRFVLNIVHQFNHKV